MVCRRQGVRGRVSVSEAEGSVEAVLQQRDAASAGRLAVYGAMLPFMGAMLPFALVLLLFCSSDNATYRGCAAIYRGGAA
eukprot:2519419-Rhodomonas_salina.1